ncbi:MAG: 4Fe-4S dicluster domain-containing protein [Burkholderiaceae bacterium]
MGKGFFTDTTVCIGCKACQVACHEWNQIPTVSEYKLLGTSYDNTGSLSAENWRHVKFIEQFPDDSKPGRWLMMSDVCKHCTDAPCMVVCPTNAIMKTEFETVYIQQDTCNGCRDCVAACPFGVISMSAQDKKAHKCTLCYDRLQHQLEPACAKACPTKSIIFGDTEDLWKQARSRVDQLHAQGQNDAYLYGDQEILGGLGAFYLLVDKPEIYGLPSHPQRVEKRVLPGSLLSIGTAILIGLGAVFSFRGRRMAAGRGSESEQ